MKKYFVFAVILSSLIACGKKQESTHAQLKSLTESVYASGTIKAEDEYKVFANTSGLIDQILIEEGDTVHPGQPIIRIENDNTSLNQANSKIALSYAQENYSENSPMMTELKIQIQNAQNKYEIDSLNFIRYKTLRESEAISESAFEQYKLAFETSANNLKAAKSRYNSSRQQLRNEIERAENAYKMSNNTNNYAVIESRINGKVYGLYKNPGEMVMMQEPIALIGNDHHFIAELLIDETDISKLRVGQKVLLTLDTYGDEIFEGKVAKIYPLLDQRSQTFRIEVEFNQAPEILFPGLSIEGNIIITEKKQALVIPKAYLIDKKFVLNENGEKIKVETGLENMEYIEILSGIDSTQNIYLPVEE